MENLKLIQTTELNRTEKPICQTDLGTTILLSEVEFVILIFSEIEVN